MFFFRFLSPLLSYSDFMIIIHADHLITEGQDLEWGSTRFRLLHPLLVPMPPPQPQGPGRDRYSALWTSRRAELSSAHGRADCPANIGHHHQRTHIFHGRQIARHYQLRTVFLAYTSNSKWSSNAKRELLYSESRMEEVVLTLLLFFSLLYSFVFLSHFGQIPLSLDQYGVCFRCPLFLASLLVLLLTFYLPFSSSSSCCMCTVTH